jgi:hypothetical protein
MSSFLGWSTQKEVMLFTDPARGTKPLGGYISLEGEFLMDFEEQISKAVAGVKICPCCGQPCQELRE